MAGGGRGGAAEPKQSQMRKNDVAGRAASDGDGDDDGTGLRLRAVLCFNSEKRFVKSLESPRLATKY
jgi:hypothetical protein